MKYQRKRRVSKPEQYNVNFRFWNGGEEYICQIVAPVSIEKYRLKEVFDRNFVSKKPGSINPQYNPFYSLNRDISYTIIKSKEA
jgi:hypothetical protein